ncbi:MAG: YfhO family protein [Chloroflexi bacterium]|nr:YfhO family protein [Chloroflexota bacterium]
MNQFLNRVNKSLENLSFRKTVPALLIIILLGFLFFRFFLLGQVYTTDDFLSWFYPWRYYETGSSNSHTFMPGNVLLRDVTILYAPEDRFFNESIKSGILPLWNPYNLCGLPLQAVGYPNLLNPLRVMLHLLFPPGAAHTWILIISLLLSGLGANMFLRSIKLSRLSSAFGGMVWMLSGFVIAYMQYEYVPLAAANLAWGLYFAELLFGQGRKIHIFSLALIFGSLLLVGMWQFILYTGLFIVLYSLFRSIQLKRYNYLAILILVIIMGAAAGAAQLLPSVQLFAQSQRPTFTTDELFAGSRFYPENLLTILIPDFLGHPAKHFYLARVYSGVQNYIDQCAYTGVIPFFLALIGLWNRRRGIAVFMGVSGLLILLFAMGTPVIKNIVLILPGFKNLIPTRILYLFTFCISILSALGLEHLLEKRRQSAALLLIPGSIFLLLTIGLSIFFRKLDYDPQFAKSFLAFFPAIMQMPNYCPDPQAFLRYELMRIFSHFSFKDPSFYIPLSAGWAGILLMFLWCRGKISRSFLAFMLIFLVSVDLIGYGLGLNPSMREDRMFFTPAGIKYLQRDTTFHRVAGLRRMAVPNSLMPYRLYDLAGNAGMMPRRIYELVRGASGDNIPYIMAYLLEGKNYYPPLASFLNIKYHYTDLTHPLPPKWGTKLPVRDMGLYVNERCLPRFFMAGKYQVVKDTGKVLSLMLSPYFVPAERVFLEEEPDSAPAPADEISGEVTVEKYTPNRVDLNVESDKDCFLVMSETYYPGWKAAIDGAPVRIYRADYAFRAIVIPKGVHKVTMEFRPPLFYYGLWVSLAGIITCIGGLLYFKRKRLPASGEKTAPPETLN